MVAVMAKKQKQKIRFKKSCCDKPKRKRCKRCPKRA